MFKYTYKDILKYAIVLVWICNCLVASLIAIHQLWIPYMDAGSDAYTKIISDPFDGTIMPITYIPDWSKIENQDKSRRFEDIPISDYIPIPQYDALSLSETNNSSKTSMIMHFTYITPYM
jgi:hypothetical protein